MYRKDADRNEINNLMNNDSNDQFIHVWRTFDHIEKPHSWRVWPHSESKGWLDRIEQVISYE